MGDDNKYLNDLPAALEQLGTQFLSKIRDFHSGRLQFHSTSGKYVETPNFYTVKIQDRDRSLRITLYGNPEDYNTRINLKNDMRGYSAFKLSSINDLDEALKLVKRAKSLKVR